MDYQLLLMCCAALLAGFVDSIAAGYQYSKKVEIPWRTVIYASVIAGMFK